MTSILNRIEEYKKEEVAALKRAEPHIHLNHYHPSAVRDFVQALDTHKTAIIAEIKRASPSQGVIREHFHVPEIAKNYADNGASCLSVLTDIHFFKGDTRYIEIAKNNAPLPVLRKDFIVDEYQVLQSRALGADCILLIVALLDDHQLQDYCQLAQSLGMAVLVESHTLAEFERAVTLPTPLMGINNRDLHTFKIDLNQSIQIIPYLPPDKRLITESGINTREDIEKMHHHGIHTFLIGEALMRQENYGSLLRELIND